MATENVAQFPAPDLPSQICTYEIEYLKYYFHRNGWKRAAERIGACREHLSPTMVSFCREIAGMTRRPSVRQLALLLSLDVNIGAQKLFAQMAEEERNAPKPISTASITKLKPKK